MVTKADLLADNKRHTKEKVREKKASEKHCAEERKRWQAEHTAKVNSLLNGELGELLTKLNAEGLKVIRIDGHRVWKPEECMRGGWSECYGNSSPLGFAPRKDYPPTMRLVRKLRRAGFSVKLEVKQHQNYEYVTTADGYDAVETPGKHPVYYMRISW